MAADGASGRARAGERGALGDHCKGGRARHRTARVLRDRRIVSARDVGADRLPVARASHRVHGLDDGVPRGPFEKAARVFVRQSDFLRARRAVHADRKRRGGGTAARCRACVDQDLPVPCGGIADRQPSKDARFRARRGRQGDADYAVFVHDRVARADRHSADIRLCEQMVPCARRAGFGACGFGLARAGDPARFGTVDRGLFAAGHGEGLLPGQIVPRRCPHR